MLPCPRISLADLERIRKSWLKEELHWLDNVNVLPEMESNNSDLVLVGISANSLTYDQPVNDPFFSAHRAEVRYYSNQNNETVYLADRNSAVMGCQERVSSFQTNSEARLMRETVSVLCYALKGTGYLYQARCASRKDSTRGFPRRK